MSHEEPSIELNVKISSIHHTIHVDKDLLWTFDHKVDPNTIFKKVKEIAQDDCGSVFELIHIPSDTHLVGKTTNETTFSSKKIDLIKGEFVSISKVVSEFITRYYGSIILSGNLTFLMEYYSLGSVRDIIDRKKAVLTEQQASFVLHDLLCALNVLHKKHKIAHRDVRASNVFLTADGFCKLSVFGFTRCFDARQESTLPIFVAPYWMAPEVVNMDQIVRKSDVWSAAITALELVIGAPPLINLTATRAMIVISQSGIEGNFPFKNRFSDEFVDFIISCTVIDPLKRPSAKKMLEHPFIKKCESLDRMEVMKNLISDVDDAAVNDIHDDEFNEKTKAYIDKYISMFRK